MGTMLESVFVHDVFKPALESAFPGCMIIKQDSGQRNGIPDLLFLWRHHWAMFETKRGSKSAKQPHQDYYVELLDSWSMAAFVNPNNYLDVLAEMERRFS